MNYLVLDDMIIFGDVAIYPSQLDGKTTVLIQGQILHTKHAFEDIKETFENAQRGDV